MKNEWFEQWFDSPYYHVLYQSHDEAEAKVFIDHFLKALALPPGARVLDLGCGKGRHARYLSEHGFEVTGLDISAANIAYARHFEHERLSFYRHDMRRPFRFNFFDAIVNIFTSFGYFETEEDHLDALRNVHKGLKPGGLFLLDFFNAAWVRSHLVKHEVKTLDGIEFHVKKSVRQGRVFKRVDFKTGGRKFAYQERVRLFSLSDFQRLFSVAGLEIKQVFGSYYLEPFQENQSKRLILVASKPNDHGLVANAR